MIRKGSGPRILALHGGDGPIARFPFANQLAERYEVIQPVHPGISGGTRIMTFVSKDLEQSISLREVLIWTTSTSTWTSSTIWT